MDVKTCNLCNVKIIKNNFEKDRNLCKNSYNIKRKQYNNNTYSIKHKNKKEINVVRSVNFNINRTLTVGFSNCGKNYLMNHFLHQKQEPVFIITKSLNQYPNIEAQTSDEI